MALVIALRTEYCARKDGEELERRALAGVYAEQIRRLAPVRQH